MPEPLTPTAILAAARSLHSEQGENPEYDRALAELAADLISPMLHGLFDDHESLRDAVAERIRPFPRP